MTNLAAEGLDLSQIKALVIEPALVAIGMNSIAAVNLLTGTMLVESGGRYLAQLENGPARGIFQMEQATHDDIWTNWLAYQREVTTRVQSLLAPGATWPQIVWNMQYAAAMARIKYRRAPDALPSAKDPEGMADYHAKIYNAGGKTNATANIPLFLEAIAA